MYSSSVSEATRSCSESLKLTETLVEIPVFYDRSCKPDRLVDVPVNYKFDSDSDEELQLDLSDVEMESTEQGHQQNSERPELSEPFNFVLPADYVPAVIGEEIPVLSIEDRTKLPLARRLKGWIREIRHRPDGRLDFFYYHLESGDKQYRSFRNVKRFIYLGFFPSAENGNKHLEQWVMDQPNPREEGASSPSAALNTDSPIQETTKERRTRLKTEIVELSEPFNFLLPKDYVPLEDDDDEEIQKLSNGEVKWLPLAERLKGWIRETRSRASGRLDFFYYHKESGEKQYRSFRDVKRYIYLGFFPSENGDKHLEQWVLDQPNPREEGAPIATAVSNSSINTTHIQEETSWS